MGHSHSMSMSVMSEEFHVKSSSKIVNCNHYVSDFLDFWIARSVHDNMLNPKFSAFYLM